jgi:Bacterial protein of unknown function (HtrL_YibB)
MSLQHTTLVTAYISNINLRADRDVKDYLQMGFSLFNSKIPKVMFIDQAYASLFPSNEITRVIPLQKEDIPLFNRVTEIKWDLITDNPSKDTIEYVAFQCSKTDFLRRAIDLNPFGSDQFVWVDFGISSLFQNSLALETAVTHIGSKTYNNVRIGHIDDLEQPLVDIYRRVCWKFAGGCFGGSSATLKEFAALTQKTCVNLIDQGKLMWEVNVWALIYLERPELFSPYRCNHNPSLLFEY